jgi:hypothetical protein
VTPIGAKKLADEHNLGNLLHYTQHCSVEHWQIALVDLVGEAAGEKGHLIY